jgi:tetratricopeptide (TPR) repeat protein
MKTIDPNASFQAAEKAIVKGDWGGARRAYGRVLKSMPKDWRGYYRAGLLEARGGHYELAERALTRAGALSRDNAQVAANLAQIYHLTGRSDQALGLLEPLVSRVPRSSDLQRQLGVVYQELGRLELADDAYRRAMELGAADPGLLNNRAVVLQALGRLVEAVNLLEIIRGRGDDGLEILNNLGNLYRALGRTEKAGEIFALALKQTPLSASLHRNRALLNRDAGQIEDGIAAARRASICEPGGMDGLLIIAEMQEHRADLGEAKKLMTRAVIGAPENADGAALLARIHRRDGDCETALRLLRESPAAAGNRVGSHKLLFEAAQAEQALGHYDKAFETLINANLQQISTTPRGRADPARVFDQIHALGELIDHLDGKEPSAVDLDDRQDTPVFLVGFPRSGTTLLDQVLDSHPSVVVLEERPLVAGMISRVKKAGFLYPQDLPRLKDAFLEELRSGYLEDRDGYIDVPIGSVFVDKLPLNIVHVALIQRVFPHAKFLLSLRDPCDVCLSCFAQSFELNDWMAVFTDIAETARMYDAVFDLWSRTSEKIKLNHHAVRYEDLISDLRRTASAAVTFLGLEWHDGMAAFHEHAKRRGHLATPSHAQVTQPIYGHAVRRWKRYGDAMDDIADFLGPRRAALGYGD